MKFIPVQVHTCEYNPHMSTNLKSNWYFQPSTKKNFQVIFQATKQTLCSKASLSPTCPIPKENGSNLFKVMIIRENMAREKTKCHAL